ncbi:MULTISPECIES: AfsR/SARP family transcriptional regulator [Catenuloplanes]|uniref:DNA-binding SARP family transcriptional activator n=1 Tax=Catenuloplanes niger TaxID=587534 RepID=A0AAE3ZL62_9ACTN|nr:BTAD domain-containing putative transcriptional regulator [Catenuloplanes niger]MDR7320679.1 DNA-binding SARP family transcriptional activator [Catenuloplanes niger]
MPVEPQDPNHPAAGLRLAVLGPVRAWFGGTELDLGAPQQRSVMAMLVLREGTAVTADEIIAGMWGDDPPRTALTTIRTYVCRQRATLGRAGADRAVRIESASGGYALHVPPGTVDLSRFARHDTRGTIAARAADWRTVVAEKSAALGLCHGQPLANLPGRYVGNQRVRLEQHIMTARFDLLHARVNLGQHREVLPELTALAADQPLREDVQALLMTALYASGRVADALMQYQRARRTIVEELGVEPSVSLRQAQQRILVDDPSLVVAPVPPAAPARQRPPARPLPRRVVRRSHRRLSR